MDKATHLEDYIITEHAKFEMERRAISLKLVEQIISNPEQCFLVRKGRQVYQSLIQMSGKQYVVRIFVDIDRSPPEVVTAYRTSKIDKYWEK
jgi:hypothetical protein